MKKFNNQADLTSEYLDVFLKKKVPTSILLKFICTPDHLPIQDFISSNLKDEFSWMTAISLMDSIDSIIDDSLGNHNLSFEAHWKFIEGVFYLISWNSAETLYPENIVYESIKNGKIQEVESTDKNGNVYLKNALSIERIYLRRVLNKFVP